jgi:glycosyltransferase involved in cell wall biosynthesis
MKLVFINRYFYPDHSATSQMLSDLAFFLSAEGRSVHVVTSRLRYDQLEETLLPSEDVRNIIVHRVWTSRFGRHFLPGRAIDYLTFYLAASWKIFRLLGRGDVVITKTDPPMISVPVAWIARVRGAKLINWLQDLFPEVAMVLEVKGLKGPIGRFLLRMRNKSLQSAVVNVVISETMKDRLVAEGVPEQQISIIHNWADGDVIRPNPSFHRTYRREWGLEDKFVVGYSGNLGRAHEFDTILDAATQLRSEQNIAFLFIGGGAQRARVEEEGLSRGLDNLVFQPYQPREILCESLGVPDVHLVSLRPELEGLIVPSKFYGILAAGKPTLFIGDPQGEIVSILDEGGVGQSIQSGDSEALAQQILELYGSAEKIEIMGLAARDLFDSRFPSQHAFQKWNDVIEYVIHQDFIRK